MEETATETATDKKPKVPKSKVYKVGNDPMTHFCGETVQVSETGREYFELTADHKEAVASNSNLIWPAAE